MSINSKPNEYRFCGYTINIRQRKLINSKNLEINLSSRAFDTLLVLIDHKGEIVSKAKLMEIVWPEVIVEENNLSQAISSLRKSLGDSKSSSRFIQTVPGRGYCFVAPLDEVTENINNPNASKKESFNFTLQYFSIALLLLAASTFFYFNLDNEQIIAKQADSLDAVLLPDSIAIFPFTILNSDSNADENLFSLGLHNELINQLSKISSLNVISRDSVISISRQEQSVVEFGRQLKVESIMTGSILFINKNARINLQMLEPETGITLWAATYDVNTHNLEDMISIQSDISINVALALEAEIKQQEKLFVEEVPTQSFEAHRFLLAARNAYYAQEFQKTWSLSRQALTLDPNYIDALFTFSYVNTVLTGSPLADMNSVQHYQLALESAEKIIQVAPQRSEGYALKAAALSTNKRWSEVAEEVKKLKLMGVAPADMKFYAVVLLCLGDFQGAIEILEANLQIEPINLFGRGFLLAAYELTGNSELARQEYQLGSELNPIWWGNTVNIFLSLGRNEPIENIDKLHRTAPELRDIFHTPNDQIAVLAKIESYLNNENQRPSEAVFYSALAANIGEPELALDLIRIGLEDVWLGFYWLWLPVFDETRKLEGFKQLLVESEIVDYWQNYGWPDICQPEGDSFTCH